MTFHSKMKLKGFIVNVAISLFTITVFLLVAELFTRAFWNVGYRHVYDWSNRTDGYFIEKEEGSFRIVVLGDSIAYGQGVMREETFSKLLEKHLNVEQVNKDVNKYEVINIAWPGINTADEYNHLRFEGLRYDPDLILVAYNLNDLGDVHARRLTLQSPFYIRSHLNRKDWPMRLPIPLKLDLYLTINSDFYMFILTKYDYLLKKLDIRKVVDHEEGITKPYRVDSEGWKQAQMYMSRIRLLGKRIGAKSMLIILPYYYNLSDYKFGWIHDKVAKTSKEKGFYTLDLLPYFKNIKSEDFIVSRIDSHPNAKAHKIMAEHIHRFIVEEKLLEDD